jgi:lactate racemase
VQVQAKIQSHAQVVMRTSYLSASDLAEAHLGHTEDVADAVGRALHDAGPDSRVCVLPEGPQTIPYVA